MKNNFGLINLNNVTFDIKTGDIKYNEQKIIEILNNSKDDIVIFQDMPLTGIFSYDLFLHDDYLNKILNSLNNILTETIYTNLFLISIPYKLNNNLYKILLLINNKKIVSFNNKQILNKYEEKYFKETIKEKSINLLNTKVLNNNFHSNLLDNKYLFNYCYLSDINQNYANSNLLITIGNESFSIDKKNKVKNVLAFYSEQLNSTISYLGVSNLESSSKYIYNSLYYIFENGLEKDFNTDFNLINKSYTIDLDFSYFKQLNQNNSYKKIINLQYENKYIKLNKTPFVCFKDLEIINNMAVNGIIKKLTSLNYPKIVLGYSGGLDSTISLLFAYQALSELNLDPRKYLLAVQMPTSNNTSNSKKRSLEIIENLKLENIIININDAVNLQNDLISNESKTNLTYENIQARIRTNSLMNICNKEKGILLGTGDFSEICFGFMTYGADQLSMYNPNRNLAKTLIRELITYLANTYFKNIKKPLLETVDAPVSPELLINQETENILGLFLINDFIIYHHLKSKWSKEKFIHVLTSTFKLKEQEAITYMNRFYKKFYSQQFKRIFPEGITIFEDVNINELILTGDNEVKYE